MKLCLYIETDCPNCGETSVSNLEEGKTTPGFYCEECGEEWELPATINVEIEED